MHKYNMHVIVSWLEFSKIKICYNRRSDLDASPVVVAPPSTKGDGEGDGLARICPVTPFVVVSGIQGVH